MGTFRIPITSSIPLIEVFGEMPVGFKTFVREGFSLLARVPQEAFPRLRDLALAFAESPLQIDEQGIASQLHLPASDIPRIITAASFLVALVGVRTEEPAQVLDALIQAGVLTEDWRPGTLRFYSYLLPEQARVQQSRKLSSLASQGLPSLTSFDTTIDVRLGFREKAVADSVPVIIVHIDTDSEPEIWFQMQRKDLEKLVDKLNETLSRVKEAAEWIKG